MSMIFQEPMTSLNPVHTIGHQIVEGSGAHMNDVAAAARARAVEMLDLVRIPSAASASMITPITCRVACASG
jgi:peptide/nickel transport system ATP-binding protein